MATINLSPQKMRHFQTISSLARAQQQQQQQQQQPPRARKMKTHRAAAPRALSSALSLPTALPPPPLGWPFIESS